MIAAKVTLHEQNGLHMRPAMRVVEKCKKYQAKVTICRNCKEADGCSILDLMLLEAADGSELEIRATGDDENLAVQELSHLFEYGGGI